MVGIREAEAAMTILESTQCGFDYEKVDLYRTKVQAFLDRKNANFPGQPFLFNLSSGRTTLPTILRDRLEVWMSDHPEYSPYMRTFATYYLISLLDDACDATLYVPLAQCVAEGGDFYLECGMLYLRDAAAVSTFVDNL